MASGPHLPEQSGEENLRLDHSRPSWSYCMSRHCIILGLDYRPYTTHTLQRIIPFKISVVEQSCTIGGAPYLSSLSNNNLTAIHGHNCLCESFEIQVGDSESLVRPKTEESCFEKTGSCPGGRPVHHGPGYRPGNSPSPL